MAQPLADLLKKNAPLNTVQPAAGMGLTLDANGRIPASVAVTGPQVVVNNYGTTLPTLAVDGMEYILVDSVTAPTYQWRFRYNAGSSSAYKWEFVGGPPLTASIATAETNATQAAWMDMATIGPAATLPRAGEYLVGGSASIWNNASASELYIGAVVGAGTPVDPRVSRADVSAVNVLESVSFLPAAPALVVAAGDSVRMRYYASASGLVVFKRNLVVIPVRVS